MASKKAKRKIEYKGAIFFWYVRVKNKDKKVLIISEDKKIILEYPFFDSEIPITPQAIREHLNKYYDRQLRN